MREIIVRVWTTYARERKVLHTIKEAELFTGFRAENGDLIFEGDLIKWEGAHEVNDGEGSVVMDKYSHDFFVENKSDNIYGLLYEVAYKATIIKETPK